MITFFRIDDIYINIFKGKIQVILETTDRRIFKAVKYDFKNIIEAYDFTMDCVFDPNCVAKRINVIFEDKSHLSGQNRQTIEIFKSPHNDYSMTHGERLQAVKEFKHIFINETRYKQVGLCYVAGNGSSAYFSPKERSFISDLIKLNTIAMYVETGHTYNNLGQVRHGVNGFTWKKENRFPRIEWLQSVKKYFSKEKRLFVCQ